MTLYSYATSEAEMAESSVSAVLNTYFNILKNHPPEKNREYHIQGDYSSKVEVYSDRGLKKNAKKKVVELGWDNHNKRWYTDAYNSSVEFDNDFKKLKPFTSHEFEKLSLNMKKLYSIKGIQQNTLKFLQHGLDMTPLDFSKISRVKPSDPKNLENVSESGIIDTCENLLNNNSGLFLGIEFSHLEQDLSDLICDLIKNLHKQNVKHIYVDEPGSSCYRAFEKFNSISLNGRSTEDSSEDLLRQLRLVGVNMAAEKIKLYRAARLCGIEVWPIGTHHVPRTLREFNGISVRCSIANIDYYREKLKDDEKFIVINGAAFYAIGEQHSIPSVRINCNTSIMHLKSGVDVVEKNQMLEEVSKIFIEESSETEAPGSVIRNLKNVVVQKSNDMFDKNDIVNRTNDNLFTQINPLDALMIKKFGFDFICEYSLGKTQEARAKKVIIPTLFDACWDGDIDAVKYLLESGQDFNQKDEAKKTSLDIAIATENKELEDLFMEKVRVNKLCNFAQEKDIGVLNRYVIDLKASGIDIKKLINTAFQNGYTALHYAAHAQNTEALKYLVDQGGNLLLKTYAGKSPTDLLKQSTKFSGSFMPGWTTQTDNKLDKDEKKVELAKANTNHI